MFNIRITRKFQSRLQIRLQVSSTSNVTGPTVETTSKGVGKAKRDWNTANSEVFKHLWKKKDLFFLSKYGAKDQLTTERIKNIKGYVASYLY